MRAELYRYKLYTIIEKLDTKQVLCTMRHTKYLVNARFRSGSGVKDPNLKELYRFATGKEIEHQHNSQYDTLNLWVIIKTLYDKKLF